MKHIIHSLLLFILFNCTGQHRNQARHILGKWIGDRTILLFEEDTLKVNHNDLQEIFFLDSMYWGFAEAREYETFSYDLIKNNLIINGENLELLELNDSILAYKRETLIPDKFRVYYFKKATGTDW
ncbi:MAG: hypothetical protein AAGA66_11040 [Bacteroidota bacterium]